MKDFEFVGEDQVYLDAACQSLRPVPVMEALNRYFFTHNSCGERVKYPWGEKTDALVEGTRKKVLKFLKLSPKDYFTSFTLNTTYGVNLILNSVRPELVEKVVTSDIEHNSPFLATMTLAKKLGVPRIVLKRGDDGSLPTAGKLNVTAQVDGGKAAKVDAAADLNFNKALVVVNVAANFDGRRLVNLKDFVKKVHKDGGIIVLDAAQAMAHGHEILEKTEADAICFSAHKMYAPSLGVIVARQDLVPKLEVSFIGGGMVDDVFADRFLLSAFGNKDHIHTIFEPGLQAWGEICALGAAIDWLAARTKKDKKRLADLTQDLYDFLQSKEKIHLVNHEPNATMSFYVDGIDSHLLGAALAKQGIMARTGYFCAHYYLDKVCKYPPLVRFSLSYATRASDIERVKKALEKI